MKLYLIGGSACTGKSTYAMNLAKQKNCSWLSTDVLRDTIRKAIKKEDFPDLFISTEYDFEEYYKNFTDGEIFLNEIIEAKALHPIITHFIKQLDLYKNQDKFILEGIALTPEYMNSLPSSFPNISFEFKVLLNNDENEIRRRIYKRGLWDDPSDYPDWIKEREVKWVLYGNEWFEEEARKFNIQTHKSI